MGHSALISHDEVEKIDADLLRLARGTAALRLIIGEALEALATMGGHHQLGFPSLEAYARERCERTGRWASDTRALARRLQRLPHLRRVLREGRLGWSVVELLARHVTPETERSWLERAGKVTVRELRKHLRSQDGVHPEATSEVNDDAESEELDHLLTVTVNREDAWFFECASRVGAQVGAGRSTNELLEAMLAEALPTLAERAPQGSQDAIDQIAALEARFDEERRAQAEWCAQRERWREEAEILCRHGSARPYAVSAPPEVDLPDTPEGLDRELRRWCKELAERDIALGFAAQRARHAGVWRRLGFASEEHYARERLGVSLSSLKFKRALAARLARLPELREAVSSGAIGYEAAYLLSRIATPKTIREWISRARERTLKHLREEVDAAELVVRFGNGRDQLPPSAERMERFFEIERVIGSGEAIDFEAPFEHSKVARLLEDVCAPAGQMSGGQLGADLTTREERARGRVTFRWHVTFDTARRWRTLEMIFTRISAAIGANMSFLRFVSENFCRIWLPAIRQRRLTVAGKEPAYFAVYRRDVFRCSSPVCTRRDITPHHLTFRAAGGGDEPENVTSLCVWCHLGGVHCGLLSATPPASRIRWRIGRSAVLQVEGRTRLAS